MTPRALGIQGRALASGGVLGLALMLAAGVSGAREAAGDEGGRPGAATAAPRAAAGDQRVVALNEEGSALYAAGDYRRAVERFLEAYAVDQDPNLLFNIASCYEGLGDMDAALEKYRAFLDAPGADAEGKPRAERAIERLLEDDRMADEPTVVPAPSAPEPTAAPVLAPAPPRNEARHDPLRHDPAWLPWLGLGGGSVLLAAGATVYWMGDSDHDEVTSSPGFGDSEAVARMTRSKADALVRSGKTKKAVGVTLASTGGALVLGYFAWWLLYPVDAPRAASNVDVAMNGSGASLTLSGSF